MRNVIDTLAAFVSPQWAVKRAHARRVLSYYEAARPSTQRKQRKETASGTTAVTRAGKALREQARHLEQNHDLARGVLQILVQNVVGPAGIGIEPTPRTPTGEIDRPLAAAIRTLFRDWAERPEVTWRHDFGSAQRLAARSWFRDGEVLAQHLAGGLSQADHGSLVPYSFQLLEADLLPLDMTSEKPLIRAGVELSPWQRPIAYHFYRAHPGDGAGGSLQTDRHPAEKIMHVALIDRINQARGVSVFASVLGRLDDLKDYEESERIAAKVAASMAAFIIKGAPDNYTNDLDDNGEPEPRDLRFRPGMVFDDLEPGESIGTIDTSRPSTQLEPHRKGQLRAIASGTNVSYSAASKDYNGTYSAQRQELVESFGAYGVLAAEFIGQFVRPVYKQFIAAAINAGTLPIPRTADPMLIDDALFIPPQMPWIDPLKEANAWTQLEKAGYASGPEIIRRRGHTPADVLEQESAWRQQLAERGIETDITGQVAAMPDETDETDDEVGNAPAQNRFR